MKPDRVNRVAVSYEEPVEELVQYIESPSEKRWAAFVALGYKPGPNSLQALIRYMVSPDPNMRRAAIEATGYHREVAAALPALRICLHDGNDLVVAEACKTLSLHSDIESRGRFISLLKHASAGVRVAALRAIHKLWKEEDFLRVLGCYQQDRSPEVRKEAAMILMERANQANWAVVFNEFRSDPYHHHRVWACRLAERFGDDPFRQELLPLLEDSDGHVRKAAKKAISVLFKVQ